MYLPLAVLLGVIIVGIIKPWGSDGAPPTSDSAGPISTAAAVAQTEGGAPGSPVTTRDPNAGLDVTCGTPSGWRAATLQEWLGRPTPIRSWIAIEPVEASGPLDPTIPFAPVATDVVTAIGYCAPLDDAHRPPEVAGARIWALRDGGAVALTLVHLEPDADNALGGLWGPAPELHDEPATSGGWPPGRYVIEVSAPGGGYARWLGLEIEDLGALHSIVPPAVSPSIPGPSPIDSPVAAPSALDSPTPAGPSSAAPAP